MNLPLKTTALNALHQELGASMVPFAGYSMPVQYPLGIKKEHLHTRAAAGLFDVSHMGQLFISGPGAGDALEKLLPVDLANLAVNRQRYALLTNEQGGILDDLMIARYDQGFYLVVNAACKHADIAHLRQHLPDTIELAVLEDRALIALQGPAAAKVMAQFSSDVADMRFMDSRPLSLEGVGCYLSRSGYTGEDGFEISIPSEHVEALARQLLACDEVEAIGLGARDSLRLEAGLCLYGQDMNTKTTPAEASLQWAISKARRIEGERAGGFIGAEVILPQLQQSNCQQQRVGLVGLGRAPVREGAALFNQAGEPIGQVTSGTFGPSVEKPIAMGFLQQGFTEIGTEVLAEVRGKRLPMQVAKLPFVTPNYYRG